jgi:hypothetical protein
MTVRGENIEGRKGMREFKVGDRVIVKDSGCSFTTYKDFFKQNGLEQFEGKYTPCHSIPVGKTYTVVGKGKHNTFEARYGPLYLLQSEDGNIYIGNNDDVSGKIYMELAEPVDSKIHAYDLMKLAAENPGEYEGKRYRVVSGGDKLWANGSMAMYGHYDECIIRNGCLESECGSHYDLSCNKYTVLEPIPPEPQPVSFMEAVKAYSEGVLVEVKHKGHMHTYKPSSIPYVNCTFRDESSIAPDADEILNGKWYIKQ